MTKTPYHFLGPECFWKTGVAQGLKLDDLYRKKFEIEKDCAIATVGSCFAQHISNNLKKHGFNVLDTEPAPPGLPKKLHAKYNYSTYSARYGNVYTVRQMLQIVMEVNGSFVPQNWIWEKDNKFFDAFRPSLEPEGFDSLDEVILMRKEHIRSVKEMICKMDLLIFTLGLTECWEDLRTSTVYPTAPGVLCGNFNPIFYSSKNFGFSEILNDFLHLQDMISSIRDKDQKSPRYLLTVSPVPLTATAGPHHVLSATTYSKSVLRAVAGELIATQNNIDYFPSYEIINNPSSAIPLFEQNMRTVNAVGVAQVMDVFFKEHKPFPIKTKHFVEELDSPTELLCEEAILEGFAK